jgi:hypothetical protein
MIFFRIVSNLIFLFVQRCTTLLKNVSMEISLLALECIRGGYTSRIDLIDDGGAQTLAEKEQVLTEVWR